MPQALHLTFCVCILIGIFCCRVLHIESTLLEPVEPEEELEFFLLEGF